MSPFILPCLPFSLTGERKGEKSLWRGVDELYGFYYVTLMAKRTCAWLHHPLKLLPLSALLSCTDSSHQDGFDVETCMHVLGLWYANTAGRLSSEYTTIMIDYKIVSSCTNYVTDCKICNIFMLEQIDLHVFSTCNLPITAASLC